jgi:hypothetical protein
MDQGLRFADARRRQDRRRRRRRQGDCVGRYLISSDSTLIGYRAVAQLAERRSPKPQVGGSIPSCPASEAGLTISETINLWQKCKHLPAPRRRTRALMILSVLAILGGIWAFYWFDDQSLALRVAMVVTGVLAGRVSRGSAGMAGNSGSSRSPRASNCARSSGRSGRRRSRPRTWCSSSRSRWVCFSGRWTGFLPRLPGF